MSRAWAFVGGWQWCLFFLCFAVFFIGWGLAKGQWLSVAFQVLFAASWLFLLIRQIRAGRRAEADLGNVAAILRRLGDGDHVITVRSTP